MVKSVLEERVGALCDKYCQWEWPGCGESTSRRRWPRLYDGKPAGCWAVAGQQILRVSDWSIYDAVRQGLLPSVRIGRKVRIEHEAFCAWVNQGGMTYNKTVHGSRRDAQRYINGVLRDMDLGKFCPPTKIVLDKFLDQWLENKVNPRVWDSTFRSYEQLMRCYVRPGLGSKMISKITGEDVQELYLAMAKKGLAASTIQKVHTVLGSALRQAVKWGTLGVNPAAEVELPKDCSTRREERIKIFPLDRVQKFLDHARCSRWGVLWAVALGTGMRPS